MRTVTRCNPKGLADELEKNTYLGDRQKKTNNCFFKLFSATSVDQRILDFIAFQWGDVYTLLTWLNPVASGFIFCLGPRVTQSYTRLIRK